MLAHWALNSMNPIPGYDGYLATEDGRIFTCRRIGCISGTSGEPRELRQVINKRGYKVVNLTKGGNKRSVIAVHRLILLTFVGPPSPEQRCTRHLNGNRLDNRRDNLAWGTHAENQADAVRHGTCPFLAKNMHRRFYGRSKLSEDDVRTVRAELQRGATKAALARRFGVRPQTISAVYSGQNWSGVK